MLKNDNRSYWYKWSIKTFDTFMEYFYFCWRTFLESIGLNNDQIYARRFNGIDVTSKGSIYVLFPSHRILWSFNGRYEQKCGAICITRPLRFTGPFSDIMTICIATNGKRCSSKFSEEARGSYRSFPIKFGKRLKKNGHVDESWRKKFEHLVHRSIVACYTSNTPQS